MTTARSGDGHRPWRTELERWAPVAVTGAFGTVDPVWVEVVDNGPPAVGSR
jgi:hypothetical protein